MSPTGWEGQLGRLLEAARELMWRSPCPVDAGYIVAAGAVGSAAAVVPAGALVWGQELGLVARRRPAGTGGKCPWLNLIAWPRTGRQRCCPRPGQRARRGPGRRATSLAARRSRRRTRTTRCPRSEAGGRESRGGAAGAGVRPGGGSAAPKRGNGFRSWRRRGPWRKQRRRRRGTALSCFTGTAGDGPARGPARWSAKVAGGGSARAGRGPSSGVRTPRPRRACTWRHWCMVTAGASICKLSTRPAGSRFCSRDRSPGSRRLTVLAEMQRLPREWRYQLQDPVRGGRCRGVDHRSRRDGRELGRPCC